MVIDIKNAAAFVEEQTADMCGLSYIANDTCSSTYVYLAPLYIGPASYSNDILLTRQIIVMNKCKAVLEQMLDQTD